jgi:two-component system sensor histidine kinase/response regulator
VVETGADITYGDMPWVWGERIMLGRLFQNLISNAIKFHKPGKPPLVHISCMREEGTWHFMVSDSGIGIEEPQRERIFGLFQRVHAQSAYPGSGIGLATCKKITELHGGRIWVESTLGAGSTFHVVLPLAGDEMPEGMHP